MNKEIMKELSGRYGDIDEEIRELIKKKNREREHAKEVAEACQKAYDEFIEALKGVIGDNSEHHTEDEEWSDKFIIKDSMTGNPVYEYRISTSISFLSDKWVDDDDDSYYDASEMKIHLYFASPLAEYYGDKVFRYKMSSNKCEMIFKSSELESDITFAYPFRIRVGDECHEVFNKIRKSDKFSWEHLAQYQCQMLKLELALDDYDELCRFRIICDGIAIPKEFIDVFDRLTALSNRDAHSYIDIENTVKGGNSPMMVKIRIRECSELIKSALPFMEHFRTPCFKQRLLWMAEDACKLGLHEDQLIITEFVNTIPDPSDKWEL